MCDSWCTAVRLAQSLENWLLVHDCTAFRWHAIYIMVIKGRNHHELVLVGSSASDIHPDIYVWSTGEREETETESNIKPWKSKALFFSQYHIGLGICCSNDYWLKFNFYQQHWFYTTSISISVTINQGMVRKWLVSGLIALTSLSYRTIVVTSRLLVCWGERLVFSIGTSGWIGSRSAFIIGIYSLKIICSSYSKLCFCNCKIMQSIISKISPNLRIDC
jgi:hypothetical protein